MVAVHLDAHTGNYDYDLNDSTMRQCNLRTSLRNNASSRHYRPNSGVDEVSIMNLNYTATLHNLKRGM